MKTTILCLFLFIFSPVINCFPQNSTTDVFQIHKLPPAGVLLNKGWKFHGGDDAKWADPNYDDKSWQSIDPTLDIHDVPPLWKNSIVWFRLRLRLDDVIKDQLAMMILQAGASEIYLNGKLIRQFGTVSTNPKEIKAYNPLEKPVSFPVSKSTDQVIAVRYGLQPNLRYITFELAQYNTLNIIVNTVENTFAEYNKKYNSGAEQFMTGIFLILGIFFLAFYVFFPIQKVNLLFSLYAFLTIIDNYLSYYPAQVERWFLQVTIQNIFQTGGYLLMLYAIYRLFEEKRRWVFNLIVFAGIVSFMTTRFIYGWGWMIHSFLFNNLLNLEITRIAYNAVRHHKKGAWIIAAGGTSYFVLWLIVTLQYFGFVNNDGFSYLFFAAILSIPIAVSIYLGYDFALTFGSLKQKFAEVENLSLEKQQILAAQNEILEKQVTERTAELQYSLKELKETQSQLVQREKMASLGELTAGIAHEIQNPLNFINNFSEVSVELTEDLKKEATEGHKEVIAIADDIAGNLQKVVQHGQRADSIVKGMLQHSRTNTGKKEPIDINALADEYLRLSYHGLRAKDKDFNASFTTDFSESIGKIEVVPQDIGRVLLNLYNNAFYAANEKKKQVNGSFEPTVSVSTERKGDKLLLRVKDNGFGIPQKVVDKIFQPFFTTKPTGQGTGLGLSLSYDIVKAHGGELKVETKEGEGAEFIVELLM